MAHAPELLCHGFSMGLRWARHPQWAACCCVAQVQQDNDENAKVAEAQAKRMEDSGGGGGHEVRQFGRVANINACVPDWATHECWVPMLQRLSPLHGVRSRSRDTSRRRRRRGGVHSH